jgi:sulfonate transport system ATP-binding protein
MVALASKLSNRPIKTVRGESMKPVHRGIHLTIENLRKQFGNHEVLSGIDVEIAPGDFVAIVGKSGCGKSTLLRLIAGLDKANEGSITLNQEGDFDTQSPVVRLMFQDARLLPWKRVIENVGLGLRGAWKEKALETLEQVGLAERANDWPTILSGGQRQRVALARALVSQPRLLLFDEPLGALDALTRIEMQRLIEQLWMTQRFTAILITHDVEEAVALANRVLLLEKGRIAMDMNIPLLRPRLRSHAQFGAITETILSKILGRPPHREEANTVRSITI